MPHMHDVKQENKGIIREKTKTGFSDGRAETMGKKIRDAETKKIPFMLIVGNNEKENASVSVRRHGGEDHGEMPIDKFVTLFNEALNAE